MQFFYLGIDNSKTKERVTDMLTKRNHKVVFIEHNGATFQEAFMSQRDFILASDAVICDATELDTSLGYILVQALESGKPCLMVHQKKETISKEIKSLSHKNLTVGIYEDRLELEDIVDQFAHEVGSKLDAKLFMIIPPDVNKYLEWVATHTENSKSDIVRSSVLETAHKDSKYQQFLKKFQ